MLKNLLSKDDLPVLLEKVRQGYGPRALRLFVSTTPRKRVDRTWEVTESPPKNWGSLQAVHDRWNLLATGDAAEHVYEYVARKHLADREGLVALSLACGTGTHEVRWAKTGRFARIDAFDISPKRIEKAQVRAATAGLGDLVRFEVADVRDLDLQPASYDAVIVFNALHHIAPLEPTIGRMHDVLRPGGFVFLRDYVGPNRFQWTRRQLEAADELLATLPVRYRMRWRSGTIKKRVYRPGRLAMWLSDPSEAAESSRILPLLNERFEPVERKDLGGTVLHLVLKDISHHFTTGDPKAERHLERIMAVEDELLASGELPSDFVFGVWRNAIGSAV